MSEFKIGMKISEVLKAAQANRNIPENTKQLIFNFCKHDTDGIISNETELAMLNAWHSGSTKIPMPQLEPKKNSSTQIDENGYKATYYQSETIETESSEKFYDSESDTTYPAKYKEYYQMGSIVYDNNDKFYMQSFGTHELNAENGRIKQIVSDHLVDTDGDNYADYRSTNYSKSNFSFGKTVYDMNLDGIPDKEEKPNYFEQGNHN